MLNLNKIISIVQGRTGCDRDKAWESLAQAWLELDRSYDEAQQASYLIKSAIAKTRFVPREVPVSFFPDEDLIETIPSREIHQSYGDYIIELIKDLPEEYKLATAYVVGQLLTCCKQKLQPLSVEMTRQYLKAGGFANASELSRQVFTFLITRFSK